MNKIVPATLAVLTLTAQAAEPDATVMQVQQEADLVWRGAAPGVRMGVLHGNRAAPAPYVIRVRFAPGVMSPPHLHPEERQVVVLKGTWWVGSGPMWDREATTTPPPPGSFALHRAGKVHYDGAKDDEVIVQISGVGPSGTKLVDESGQAKQATARPPIRATAASPTPRPVWQANCMPASVLLQPTPSSSASSPTGSSPASRSPARAIASSRAPIFRRRASPRSGATSCSPVFRRLTSAALWRRTRSAASCCRAARPIHRATCKRR